MFTYPHLFLMIMLWRECSLFKGFSLFKMSSRSLAPDFYVKIVFHVQ